MNRDRTGAGCLISTGVSIGATEEGFLRFSYNVSPVLENSYGVVYP